jgi:hypothetical protein
MKKAILPGMTLLLVFGTLLGQGNGQCLGPSAGMGQGSGSNAGLAAGQVQAGKNDLETVTIEGTVTAVNLHDGELTYPSIAVDGTIDSIDAEPVEVKLAPYWFLMDSNITIAVGDVLTIEAFLGTQSADEAFYAISIDSVLLRDSHGSPIWRGGHGSASVVRSAGMRNCSVRNDCIVPGSIGEIRGSVHSVRNGPGIQHLTLLVRVPVGFLLELRLAPAGYLLEQVSNS